MGEKRMGESQHRQRGRKRDELDSRSLRREREMVIGQETGYGQDWTRRNTKMAKQR